MKRLLSAAVLGSLLLAGCVNDATRLRVAENNFLASVDNADPQRNRLAAFFDEAAFGRDDALSSAEIKSFNRVLSRWVLPIRATISGDVDDAKEKQILERLRYFAGLTGVELVWEGRDARRYNFKITLINSSQIRAESSTDTICFARPVDRFGQIVSAAVLLPSNDEENFQDCIDHEFMHAFGFNGHSHRLNSALSYMHKQSRLTAWDEIMLRTLYSPRLKAGLHRDDAWPVVWSLLGEGMARQQTEDGALPDQGEEYWSVFPDEIPYSVKFTELPELPRIAMARSLDDGGAVETRAVFMTPSNSERAEVVYAPADNPEQRWDAYRPRWKKISKGGDLTDKPYRIDDQPFRGVYDTVRNGSKHCLVFARESDIPGRYFSGYYCRFGNLSASTRKRFLEALSTTPPEPAGS